MTGTIKAWLLLGGIFVVGIITGSALTFGLGPRFMHQPEPQQIQRLWMAHLVQRLNLTPDQRAKIQPILADAQAKIQSLQREQVERGSQIFKAAHDQIAAILTPEQKVELQQMEREREKMFFNRTRLGGPQGPGGQFDRRGMGNGFPGGLPGAGGSFRGGGPGNMFPYARPGGDNDGGPMPPPPPPVNAPNALTNGAPVQAVPTTQVP